MSCSLGPPKSVRDINDYQDLKSNFYPEYIAHFSITIDESKNPKMYYIQSYLQAGMQFQLLYYFDNKEDAAAEYMRLKDSALYEGTMKYITDSMDISIGFSIEVGNEPRLNDSFDILIFKAKPSGGVDFKWNHGTTAGLAYRKGAETILYWLEEW